MGCGNTLRRWPRRSVTETSGLRPAQGVGRLHRAAAGGTWVQGRTPDLPGRGKEVANLEAEIRGLTKPDEILVVGAHYDSVRGCPAANDNGTGVAGRAGDRAAAGGRRDRSGRSGSSLFVNEEPPFFQTDLMGSLVYAPPCKRRGENVVGDDLARDDRLLLRRQGQPEVPAAVQPDVPEHGELHRRSSATQARDASSATWSASFRQHAQFPSEGVAARRARRRASAGRTTGRSGRTATRR